ncbi:hypothetical protein EYZ11_003946 [Aspergillus tanneri]|uniref:Cell wall mannoprotein 1 n=1 Tax=Aspergillus tanneri TaxID=1220188 RepID=A0A4V3UPU9_9EURO|nr:uncharacterized protein ATNIH1004_010958 [Aspergillus tanneri]KAA8642018.1 hypothetical protein ATNIH1004_010958 [Aspergillus tanneri]THC96554.1 hypothetical protein EYZ11_003946 [Aspergillus tanneri]
MRLLLAIFISTFLAFVSALPTTSTLVTREANAVVDAVHKIADQMKALNTTVTSYDGGLLGTVTALKIEFKCITLSHDLKNAISTTESSPNFTDTESLSVSTSFLDLQPQIYSTLDNIVSKKPQFDNGLLGIGSLSFLVKHNLEEEKDLSAKLGSAVAAKLREPYASLAPTINKGIAEKFAAAIKVFS